MKGSQESILILLIAGIGDLIMASKAIRTIAGGHPNAEIHLLTSSDAAPLARNYPYIHRVWAFPIRELRKGLRPWLQVPALLGGVRKTRFCLAVNLYRVVSWRGALKMGALLLFLRAGEKLGRDMKGLGLFLNRRVSAEGRVPEHFVDAMTKRAVHAGGVPDQGGMEVFWDKACEEGLRYLFPDAPPPGVKTVGVNPGADNPIKRWHPEGYAIVAEHLLEKEGTRILILGGPGEEKIAESIQERLKGRAVNLAGRLTLDELAYLISRLDLLVTNDSAPMHMAAALGTPVVALFGPEDPLHTRPYTSENLYRVISKRADCSLCRAGRCDRPLCMDLIRPEEVTERCLELLRRSFSAP